MQRPSVCSVYTRFAGPPGRIDGWIDTASLHLIALLRVCMCDCCCCCFATLIRLLSDQTAQTSSPLSALTETRVVRGSQDKNCANDYIKRLHTTVAEECGCSKGIEVLQPLLDDERPFILWESRYLYQSPSISYLCLEAATKMLASGRIMHSTAVSGKTATARPILVGSGNQKACKPVAPNIRYLSNCSSQHHPPGLCRLLCWPVGQPVLPDPSHNINSASP